MATIKQPFGSGEGNTLNVGVAGTNCVAREFGDGQHHITKIDITDLELITTTNASKADGKLIYNLPAGAIVTRATKLSVAVKSTVDPFANIADTPDLGVGTTVATGAVAVLGGTAGFENLLTGQTMDDCDETVEVETVTTSLLINEADSHAVYLNIADGWAGVDAVGATGTVVLEWTLLTV
jgi:hypothetical protein